MTEQLIAAMAEAIYQYKAGRREGNWAVERRGDSRTVIKRIGEVTYRRPYYLYTKTQERKYLMDEIEGISPYVRVSDDLNEDLVSRSRHESYHRTSEHSCNGRVTKQTVMNKVRQSEPVINIPKEKRFVPILRIDADEDHVVLQNKRRKGQGNRPAGERL